ncbi:MAG: hypothetical protein IJB88_01625 [Clostridia bacterium]|nr:hypothetical protein [Clostridia bacterium]
MKKLTKQFLCLFLVIGMLVCMVACGGTEETSSEAESVGDVSGTTSVEQNSEYLVDGVYTPKLGVLDKYKDMEFSVLVPGEGQGTYQSDDFTTTPGSGGIDYGDAYYEVVEARNDLVEEKYGVTLTVYKEDDSLSKAREDATAGTYLYDALVMSVGSMATLAQDGHLCELNSLENFDVDAPWWDASANEAYSINNKLYFTTGDITIMNKANVWSILFNKQMITDNSLENPYKLVDEGKWTFDKMIEMAKQVNTATSASDWQDPTVTYGMVTAYGDIFQFFGGSGLTLCVKDTSDTPEFVFGSEESITITQHVLEEMNGAAWKIYAQDCTGGTNVWTDSFALFNDGRALFRPSGFTAVTKCRFQASMEFGILPMPKMSDTQDGYYTITSGSFVAGILKNCEDPEFSAYMLDAYAAGAKQLITPAYIDVNLKWKSLRDEESQEILEYIFDHIVYDSGLVYNFGNVSGMFQTLAQNATTDVASSLDGIRDQILTQIDQVVTDYESDM